jgi:hypothetical protein
LLPSSAGLFGFSIELSLRDSATGRSRKVTGSDAVEKKRLISTCANVAM